MMVQLEFWQVVTLLLGFLGFLIGLGKFFLVQIDKRFEAQERVRGEAQKHWDTKFAALEGAMRADAAEWSRVERSLLELKADLPVHYVRREDYIRGQTVVEAKLDGLALKIENWQLKGMSHGT